MLSDLMHWRHDHRHPGDDDGDDEEDGDEDDEYMLWPDDHRHPGDDDEDSHKQRSDHDRCRLLILIDGDLNIFIVRLNGLISSQPFDLNFKLLPMRMMMMRIDFNSNDDND